MNEKQQQVRRIIQAVELGHPKGLIIDLLKTLEVYVADDADVVAIVKREAERQPADFHGEGTA